MLKVQRILLEAGDRLSLCVFSDVPPNHPFWPAVQTATMRGWMKPKSLPTFAASRADNYNDILQASRKGRTKGIFGVDEPLSWKSANEMLNAVLSDLGNRNKVNLHYGMSDEPISKGEFMLAFCQALYPDKTPKPITTEREKISWACKRLSPFLTDENLNFQGIISRGEALDLVLKVLTEYR